MRVLALLIMISALPVGAAFLWFRGRKFPVPTHWFLLSLLAGALAPLAATLAQYLIPRMSNIASYGTGDFLFDVFIRVALTEEASKLLMLCILFKMLGGLLGEQTEYGGRWNFPYGTASGLTAGLGFALVESAFYGMGDMRIALLRVFTAAPLHGACGARIGAAHTLMKTSPGAALWRFLVAVAIHGVYNILVSSAGSIRYLSILLAFSSLLASTRELRDFKENKRATAQDSNFYK